MHIIISKVEEQERWQSCFTTAANQRKRIYGWPIIYYVLNRIMIADNSELNSLLGPTLTDRDADFPDSIRFGTLEERIVLVAKIRPMFGELHAMPTARHPQRTIVGPNIV